MNVPYTYKSPLSKCVLRIDDQMYDVSAWRGSHPGGVELMDRFHNDDATDVFYAFHSKEALQKLKRMRSKPVDEEQVPRDDLARKFRAFSQRLEDEGWFDRNPLCDIFLVILPCLAFAVAGTLLAGSHPWLATVLLGIAMQQGGWVAHDYCHSRGKLTKRIGQVMGATLVGLSADWWNHKHNTHHSFTNRLEVDADIHNEPILHIWFPDPAKDVWYRRYQHLYYLPVYSLLYASWRMQSVQFVLGSKNWTERVLLALGMVWLGSLPWQVAVGSILLAGWLVAVIVTCSHQAEDVIPTDAKFNFVREQYATTRGVRCPDPVTEYLFGGMQYQLEHHLFPTLPKYRYSRVRPLVAQFAKENGLEFKTAGIIEIMKLNYDVMKKYSQVKSATA